MRILNHGNGADGLNTGNKMAKSKAEIMKEMRARRAKNGITEVRGIWAPVGKHEAIKKSAASIVKRAAK